MKESLLRMERNYVLLVRILGTKEMHVQFVQSQLLSLLLLLLFLAVVKLITSHVSNAIIVPNHLLQETIQSKWHLTRRNHTVDPAQAVNFVQPVVMILQMDSPLFKLVLRNIINHAFAALLVINPSVLVNMSTVEVVPTVQVANHRRILDPVQSVTNP